MQFDLILRQLTGALTGAYEATEAQPAASGEPDFRVYIFAAYGAVLLLLLLFSLWSVVQTRAAERKLGQLVERLDHVEGQGKSAAGPD